MSLQQVAHASGGQWTEIAVGSWERADRAVTVAKLAGLAEFYGVATEELLPAHSAGPAAAGGRRLTIDLQRLVALPARQAGPLARYAAAIQQQRHDHNRTALTIREHDLHSLAVLYDLAPDNLAQTLINWGVLTADPPPPRQPTAPAGSPRHPTATEVLVPGPDLTGRVVSYHWPVGGPPEALLGPSGPRPKPGADTSRPRTCQRCGKPLNTDGARGGRPAKYCSGACRAAGHRARHRTAPDTAAR